MSTHEPSSEGAYAPPRPRNANAGSVAAALSLAAGTIVALRGVARRGTVAGSLMTGIGGALLYQGATGRPLLGRVRDERTDGDEEADIAARGFHVAQAFLVNKRAEELYRYWRDFEKLPRIMTYLDRVDVLDPRRSRWVAKAPLLAGGTVEWDAEITRDEPNRAIAWRSLPGAQVEVAGEIEFRPALGDRGTEVHVVLSYLPPAGRLGHGIAKLFGKAPHRTVREDLRNFKRVMEAGELPTTTGQPRGTCLSGGHRPAGNGRRES